MIKFKKILAVISLILVVFAFVGCGEPTTGRAVANQYEKITDRLTKTINNLETIKDDDLAISDISPISNTTASRTKSIIGGGINYSAKKNSSNTGNTTIRDNGTIPLRQYYNNKRSAVRGDVTKSTNDIYTKQITATNPTSLPDVTTNNNNSYTPRYINSVSENFTRVNLDNYITDIESLYALISDCLSASAQEQQCKDTMQTNIDESKDLCSQIKSGDIVLSETDVKQCNSLCDTMQTCTDKINSTRGEVNNKIGTIKKLKTNFAGNMFDIYNSYSMLLDLFDSRVQQFNTCNDCISQCNDIICNSTGGTTVKNGLGSNTASRKTTNKNSYTPNSRFTKNNINQNTTTTKNNQFSENTPYLNNQNNNLSQNNYNANTMQNNTSGVVPNNNLTNNNANVNSLPNNLNGVNNNGTTNTTPNNYNNGMTNTVPNNYNNGVTNTIPNNYNNGVTNTIPNNYNNGVTNTIPNNYNNGVTNTNPNNAGITNGFNNGINRPFATKNIDTYRNTRRNIDTYRNINKNIDSFGPNYQRTLNNNQTNNAFDNTNGTNSNNLNQTNTMNETTQNLNNEMPNNNTANALNVKSNSTPKQARQNRFANVNKPFKMPRRADQNITNNMVKTTPQDVNVTEGPLPNPFDPKKIEELNEEKEKEGLEQKNVENLNPETDKEKIQPETPTENTPKVIPLENSTNSQTNATTTQTNM